MAAPGAAAGGQGGLIPFSACVRWHFPRSVGCLGRWQVHAKTEGEERIGRLRILRDTYRLRWVRRKRSRSREQLAL